MSPNPSEPAPGFREPNAPRGTGDRTPSTAADGPRNFGGRTPSRVNGRRSNSDPTVGEALRLRREELGLSGQEAAKQLRVGPGTYNRWESDIEVSVGRLADVKEWLGLNDAEFGRVVLASSRLRAAIHAGDDTHRR